MRINAIGNNFGAGLISLKAFSSADLLVLNGRVDVSSTDPSFLAAKELEIYLPELPMRKSAETAVFMVMTRSRLSPFATVVRARIKEHGTLCIEKAPLYQNYGDFTLVFACAFVPKGDVGPFVLEGATKVSVSSDDAEVEIIGSGCVVREGWVYLFLEFGKLNGPEPTDSFGFTVDGLPEDIAAELPIIAFSNQSYDGSLISMARVEGSVFRVDSPGEEVGEARSVKFLKAFFVRDEYV